MAPPGLLLLSSYWSLCLGVHPLPALAQGGSEPGRVSESRGFDHLRETAVGWLDGRDAAPCRPTDARSKAFSMSAKRNIASRFSCSAYVWRSLRCMRFSAMKLQSVLAHSQAGKKCTLSDGLVLLPGDIVFLLWFRKPQITFRNHTEI